MKIVNFMFGKPIDNTKQKKTVIEIWMLSFIVIVAYLMIMHQKKFEIEVP